QNESFWASSGLFEYVQIFVISNGTITKYYSNTTRRRHVDEAIGTRHRARAKTSNSFSFTSYWADAKNRRVPDLVDFTKTFFARHTLLNVLTRYCVFTCEKALLVMRPYQIAATEAILSRIRTSTNCGKTGTVEAGGYVWHSTGSGKTLTSFKTAQLATQLEYIDKVLFVVDRKDLDYQTMQEYDRYAKGAANGNVSTKILQRQLEDPQARIIVTTIQKLGVFISRNAGHCVFKKHVVLIFDECHRSQFGDMHRAIEKAFKNYHIFGFTGTPIFADNARGTHTTEGTFGGRLHAYTMVDAINDGNVLPFRVDYVNTVRARDDVQDKQVPGIDTEKVMNDPKRIKQVVDYVLEHFDQKTSRNKSYTLNERRLTGFNSIFAADSIPAAMRYYKEFKRSSKAGLKIAVIFSAGTADPDGQPDDMMPDGVLPDESFDTSGLDADARSFLRGAVADYNRMFQANFDTSGESFESYYKNVSKRMKERELDILIVVNMFLTGFDAATLNTLWIDKDVRRHGLIQAFSRTNRVLNSVKGFGNIVCFRELKAATDEAIALFGNEDARGIILLKPYGEYYEEYKALIGELTEMYPISAFDDAAFGEQAKKCFVSLYGKILKLRNILSAFDDFDGHEILSEMDFQDYQSRYIDVWREMKGSGGPADMEDISGDVVFEMELVRQDEVNIDYILMLVEKYRASHCSDKAARDAALRAVGASVSLRSKKELIERFIERVTVSTDVKSDWRKFVEENKTADLNDIIKSEGLKPDETKAFMKMCFSDGELKEIGTDITNILPPMPRFGGNNDYAVMKQRVIQKLRVFFERYQGL
ncbi:MAG: type I restriction endonuclease subunit R, partial [Synergistaceae bacterium]|nr:type I restriction endonuclease subunit R [Synergistaceae bacterium]